MEDPSDLTNWINRLLEIGNLAELKIVLYLTGRPDNGEFKRITVDEFMHGAKLSRQSVITGIANAIEHGFVERKHIYNQHNSKCYKLNMRTQEVKEQPSELHEDPLSTKRRARVRRKTRNKIALQAKPRTHYKADSSISELRSIPYPDYLQSIEWKAKREKALRFAGYRCQLCNSPESLHVHHRTYERLGHERLSDLVVLCADCHDTFTYNGELHPSQEPKTTSSHPRKRYQEKDEYDFIWAIMATLSENLGDEGHIHSNRIQACHIYDNSGLDQELFLEAINKAKEIAEQANIRKMNGKGEVNRMPYFFQCLRRDCL